MKWLPNLRDVFAHFTPLSDLPPEVREKVMRDMNDPALRRTMARERDAALRAAPVRFGSVEGALPDGAAAAVVCRPHRVR